jgi:hypothetical protein
VAILVVIAVLVFTSLAVVAIWVGITDRRRRRPDLRRADDGGHPEPRPALGPTERAANEATKWI